jgi:hypothetical protein
LVRVGVCEKENLQKVKFDYLIGSMYNNGIIGAG